MLVRREVFGHQRGDLRQREDEDEVEEQLDRRDPSLFGHRQQPRMPLGGHLERLSKAEGWEAAGRFAREPVSGYCFCILLREGRQRGGH